MSNKIYKYSGIVESGNQIGRKMGIPTVNIPVNNNEVVPDLGVYVATLVSDKYGLLKGIANIGRKPTVELFDENGNKIINPIGIEVFIFDFDGDLYNNKLDVSLHDFIRPERKFNNFDELKVQIDRDIDMAKSILSSKY